jgi:ABC-type glycerol-3-phosphate transport system substrate-binding protein
MRRMSGFYKTCRALRSYAQSVEIRGDTLRNTSIGLFGVLAAAIPIFLQAVVAKPSGHHRRVKTPTEVARGPLFNFEITDLPTNLRTDLRGTSIRFAVAENEPDRAWDDLLVAKFHELTGIDVQLVRMGNDTTSVLSSYLKHFRDGAPLADVYDVDIVWPGILSKYALDLSLAFADLHNIAPALVQNDTVNGKLVAVPYFVEISLLYYRRDLLKKYHFDHPPSTWRELEQQAQTIMSGERAEKKKQFWGFLWQGAASEALTCNALEWQISEGGGPLLAADGRLSLHHERTAAAWQRARQWIGTLSPPDVTEQLEDDSLRLWKSGNAAFMRSWPSFNYPQVGGQARSLIRYPPGVISPST